MNVIGRASQTEISLSSKVKVKADRQFIVLDLVERVINIADCGCTRLIRPYFLTLVKLKLHFLTT